MGSSFIERRKGLGDGGKLRPQMVASRRLWNDRHLRTEGVELAKQKFLRAVNRRLVVGRRLVLDERAQRREHLVALRLQMSVKLPHHGPTLNCAVCTSASLRVSVSS